MARLQATALWAWTSLRTPAVTTTVANSAILLGNALTGIISARALGPAGRGQLAIAMLWTAVIYMLGSLGLSSSCSYYVARWPNRQAALAVWAKRIALWQAAAMTVASNAILWWLHFRLHLGPLLTIEYTTWTAGAAVALYATCYAQGLGDFMRFNLFRIIPGIMPAGLMIAEAEAVHLTASEAAAAYIIPAWFAAILAWIWLRRVTDRASAGPVTAPERHSLRSYGWRSLASFSGLALNRNSDQLALGFLVPVSSLGLYTVAASASSALVSVIASFGMVGLPTVTALVGRPKVKATWRTMWRAVCLLSILSPVVALLLPLAIPLVYGAQYSAAVMPAELLLLGTVFAALASVADDLLRAHEHPGFVSVTQGAGGAVTIIGTILLDGRSLSAVALVSAVGFIVAFALALVRLCAATWRLRTPAKHRSADGKAPLASWRRQSSNGPSSPLVNPDPPRQPTMADINVLTLTRRNAWRLARRANRYPAVPTYRRSGTHRAPRRHFTSRARDN